MAGGGGGEFRVNEGYTGCEGTVDQRMCVWFKEEAKVNRDTEAEGEERRERAYKQLVESRIMKLLKAEKELMYM